MRNGLYMVQFQTPSGAGAGVVTLCDGKIGGGDGVLYYTGTYNEADNKFTAEVLTGRHTAGALSVFGGDNLHIKLSGTTQGDKAEMIARRRKHLVFSLKRNLHG
jgi:hypothetical protein